MSAPPAAIEDAAVILHLEIEVAPENRERFLDFCRRAFPVYESTGGCRMVLYEEAGKLCFFDEVGYYRTLDDYKRSERAVTEDPAQATLIKEWRSLLKAPPKVSIRRRILQR